MFDDALAQETMKALGIDENGLLKLEHECSRYKQGTYYQVAEKYVFFDWCKANGLTCSGGEVLVPVDGLKNGAIRAGYYGYPTERTVIFSFD